MGAVEDYIQTSARSVRLFAIFLTMFILANACLQLSNSQYNLTQNIFYLLILDASNRY